MSLEMFVYNFTMSNLVSVFPHELCHRIREEHIHRSPRLRDALTTPVESILKENFGKFMKTLDKYIWNQNYWYRPSSPFMSISNKWVFAVFFQLFYINFKNLFKVSWILFFRTSLIGPFCKSDRKKEILLNSKKFQNNSISSLLLLILEATAYWDLALYALPLNPLSTFLPLLPGSIKAS